MIHIKFHKLELVERHSLKENIFASQQFLPSSKTNGVGWRRWTEKLLISTLVSRHKHMHRMENINFNIFYHIHGYNILMRNPKRELLKASFNFSFSTSLSLCLVWNLFFYFIHPCLFCVCSRNHVGIKVSLL